MAMVLERQTEPLPYGVTRNITNTVHSCQHVLKFRRFHQGETDISNQRIELERLWLVQKPTTS